MSYFICIGADLATFVVGAVVFYRLTASAKASVRKENDKAEIRIADSGKTLPDYKDIFEPFVTENSA